MDLRKPDFDFALNTITVEESFLIFRESRTLVFNYLFDEFVSHVASGGVQRVIIRNF